MKKFIREIIRFSFGLILVSTCLAQIAHLFLTPYYGNEEHAIKHKYFLENKEKFNTVFFGSSRTAYHINPQIFDSILIDHNISSFNFGSAGTSIPEAYYLYENLISENIPNLKYAFIELQQLVIIDWGELNSRYYYYQNVDDLKFVIDHVWEQPFSLKRKLNFFATYSSAWLLKNISCYNIKMIFNEINYTDKKSLGPLSNGFYALDDIQKEQKEKALEQNHNRFLKDTTVLQEKATSGLEEINNANSVQIKRMLDLIDKSKKKNIHLFFVIPSKSSYTELLALAQYLPTKNLINLGDFKKYPQLNLAANTFDKGHLNKAGANLNTLFFANEMKLKAISKAW